MSTAISLGHPLYAASTPIAALRRRRAIGSAALAAGALVFSAVLVTVFGPIALAALLPPMPVALVLVWSSADYLRNDEIYAALRARA